MTHTKRTYFKALLLLVVFSLNTLVSFACSFGGVFHDFHHQTNPSTEHKHPGDYKHSDNKHKHDHKGSDKHAHDKDSDHKHDSRPSGDQENNCCSDSVVALQMTEKLVSSSIQVPGIVFATTFIGVYFDIFSIQFQRKTCFPDNIRWRPPTTIQDLRIVIQSFQI